MFNKPTPQNEHEAIEQAVDNRRLEEAERIAAWRLLQLLDAGYDMDSAKAVALSKADLHIACDLVTKRGCAPSVAAAILT